MVNFSPFYQTTEPGKLVTTKIFSSDIVSVLCPEDILSSEVKNTSQVLMPSFLILYVKQIGITNRRKQIGITNRHKQIVVQVALLASLASVTLVPTFCDFQSLIARFKTVPTGNFSHPKQIRDSNQLTNIQ